MCCGKKRAGLTGHTTGMAQRSAAYEAATFTFRYIGDTALTTVGAVTGKAYRFPSKGAVQVVHRDDAAGLQQVPNLVRMD